LIFKDASALANAEASRYQKNYSVIAQRGKLQNNLLNTKTRSEHKAHKVK